ncbi:YdcP family protein [Loigolactobacillus coryniformis]|uniref:Conjugal transfer protein n=1 Tax=Loigolactobacillus coryniformis subsp. torquens DSM 20004 = KCTC 3535 TaxID=1423822 RepID=A0A2D1KLK7_9LACO|nr:YdcP family protein [Loigolactobacillus coryniformis]ATO43055.1 conjugal transfer protein [Loigolactobacillus coryniformis subsp. torquens DSM 20004 = KCTC 3535]KRK84210.1 hypothetical protein FC16_GL001647 [Loigolactobacillus coryniformis subsp. torquens DSM 20004 = KCTC 3535]
MRLAEGIALDSNKTFGALKFSAMRRERFINDDDGNQTTEVSERTFDLKSFEKGKMIQVSIPATVGEKKFDYNQLVEMVNPVIGTVASYEFGVGVSVSWYLKADDLIPVGHNKVSEKAANEKK